MVFCLEFAMQLDVRLSLSLPQLTVIGVGKLVRKSRTFSTWWITTTTVILAWKRNNCKVYASLIFFMYSYRNIDHSEVHTAAVLAVQLIQHNEKDTRFQPFRINTPNRMLSEQFKQQNIFVPSFIEFFFSPSFSFALLWPGILFANDSFRRILYKQSRIWLFV